MLCYRLFQLSNMSSWKGILQRMNELQFLWLRIKNVFWGIKILSCHLEFFFSLFWSHILWCSGCENEKNPFLLKAIYHRKALSFYLPNMKKILWDISNITKKITLKYCTILYKNSIISEAPVIQTITAI